METTKKIKPIIKWAGGKTQLITQLKKRFPNFILNNQKFNYVEPFIGSGALLFYLVENYNQNMNKILINDLNKRLIYLYQTLINNVEVLIDELQKIKLEYNKLVLSEQKNYYLQKRTEFNNLSVTTKNRIRIGVLFLFLNKTGFNGIYRENSKGSYNVPFGNHKSPSFFDEHNLKKISKILKNKLIIDNKSYEKVFLEDEKIPTFYYLDPPYIPISKTSSFTQYVKGSNFSKNSSLDKLIDYCNKITESKGYFMLSNSASEKSIDIFSSLGNVTKVKARRSINSVASLRGKIYEILIMNY